MRSWCLRPLNSWAMPLCRTFLQAAVAAATAIFSWLWMCFSVLPSKSGSGALWFAHRETDRAGEGKHNSRKEDLMKRGASRRLGADLFAYNKETYLHNAPSASEWMIWGIMGTHVMKVVMERILSCVCVQWLVIMGSSSSAFELFAREVVNCIRVCVCVFLCAFCGVRIYIYIYIYIYKNNVKHTSACLCMYVLPIPHIHKPTRLPLFRNLRHASYICIYIYIRT